MTINSETDFSEYLNQVKIASQQEQRGKLEIQLGQARLEDDAERVSELEAKIAEIGEATNPLVGIETPYPSPIAEAAFYGLGGEIVRDIEPHSEADPVAIMMNLLAAFGNIIGTGAFFTIGADKHPCKLFCIFVGDTAKGRKGTSWSPVRTLFEFIEPEWVRNNIQNGLSSGEGLIYHVRDPKYKREHNNTSNSVSESLEDAGVLDKRLLILEGELAQTLKVLSREGNTLSPVIRLAWDSGNLQTLTKSNPVRATDTHISIIGHITKRELAKRLSEIETGNGFANRFLFLCVRRSKELAFGGNFNEIDLESLAYRLREAVDFAKDAGEIRWADETRPQWKAVYPELSEGKPGIIGDIISRAEAQVTRLACIYALLDRSLEIKPAHLRAALAIWEYSEASVRYIFQNIANNTLANKILNSLSVRSQGMTKTEINNLLKRNYSSEQVNEALNELRALHMAFSKVYETKGRPVERWFSTQSTNELNELNEKRGG